MPIMKHNATRERLIAARDAFRNETQQAAPAAAPAAPAPQPVPAAPAAPAPAPAPAVQPEMKAPDKIETPVGFETAFANLSGVSFPDPEPKQEPVNQELTSAREENAKLMKELEELRKQRETDKEALTELQRLKEQKELDNYLAGTEKLDSINAEDARKLLSPLLKTIKTEQSATQERFKAEREALDKRFDELNKREQALTQHKAYDTIMKAYPDMATMQQHRAYQEVMSSPIAPGSDILVGTMVARDLKLGKTDYVLNVLKTIKERMATPDINAVASVGAGSIVGTPAPDTTGDILTPEQLSDLRFAFQNRQITREEYHERLQKHREASRLRR